MISKCIAFLVAALMLANCCALGNGCAPESGTPAAWDGLGVAPTEDAQSVEPQPREHVRARRAIVVGPLDAAAAEQTDRVQSKDQWEQKQAADQDDEMRLKRKLVICSTCASEIARSGATSSSR
jgi:hypothetical protein